MMKYIRLIQQKCIYFFYKNFLSNRILDEEFDASYLERKHSYNNPMCLQCREEKLKANEREIDLSIIIPLYNSEKFIDDCVKSFINQNTQYKYEIILVDDGSVDNTYDKARYYADNIQNVCLFSQKNAGISAARNTGLINARGRYIGFADHDDWVDDIYVDRLLSMAYKEDADVVKCATKHISKDKQKIAKAYDEIIKGHMEDALYKYGSTIWGGGI